MRDNAGVQLPVLPKVAHAGLPSYSDPPIFTPISDLVSAGSDFRDRTPIFEFSTMGRIFSVLDSLTQRTRPFPAIPIVANNDKHGR